MTTLVKKKPEEENEEEENNRIMNHTYTIETETYAHSLHVHKANII